MTATLQLLTLDERAEVHERTLKVLGTVGMRVDSDTGRAILRGAGARVDESTHIVRFPPSWSSSHSPWLPSASRWVAATPASSSRSTPAERPYSTGAATSTSSTAQRVTCEPAPATTGSRSPV